VGLTHLDEKGRIVMVDVGDKDITQRVARARGSIRMNKEAFTAIMTDSVKKGNVFAAAKVASMMAVKNTSNTIPLCHPLPINHISVEFFPQEETSTIEAEVVVKVSGKTGVEMEALHGVSIALLTIYDMCKSIDKSMVIEDVRLMEKSGGKSGLYMREAE
jgi:cyclic pyranopterin phosphate synthase